MNQVERMVSMLQICRNEFRDILAWHHYETTPLRKQELKSISSVVENIDNVLSAAPPEDNP